MGLIARPFFAAVEGFRTRRQHFDDCSGVEYHVFERVVELRLTADYENIRIREQAAGAVPRQWYGTCADLGVLAAGLAARPFQLEVKCADNVDGDNAVCVVLPGHGVDFAVQIEVTLLRGALAGQVLVDGEARLGARRCHGSARQEKKVTMSIVTKGKQSSKIRSAYNPSETPCSVFSSGPLPSTLGCGVGTA